MAQDEFSWLPFGAGGIPANANNGTSLPAPRWYLGTAAPTSGNYYNVGDLVFNPLAGNGNPVNWVCVTAGAGGTAVFVPEYTDQFGSGTGVLLPEGNINRQVSGTGISPGATGADNVLATYTMPANSFDVSGRGITMTASGSFAATSNNKTLKLYYACTSATVGSTVSGGTVIATTGVVTTSGGGWSIGANVFKYGSTGSNTQLGIHTQSQVGGAVTALQAPTSLTATESGVIILAVTGNAATATSDIVFNWLEINAMN